MKTEYRAADYDNQRPSRAFVDGTDACRRVAIHHRSSRLEQTISTALVYRFNWGGPVVAKY